MHFDASRIRTRSKRLPVFLLLCGLVIPRAEAGHESPFYPSHYPQEITIGVVDPASAGRLLQNGSLHAYIGADPFAGGPIPANVSSADSLGSYLVLTFNPASGTLRDRESRCAAARKILNSVGEEKEAFIFHPHPVTPYHPDYLHHFDLAQSWKTEALAASTREQGSARLAVKISAKGKLAETLARFRWQRAEKGWDAAAEEVDVGALVASRIISLNGWLGPPWLKEGWFHAYMLLADAVTDAPRKHSADEIYQRLAHGAYEGLAEKLNLERALVSLLTRGCERVVVGYTLRREYFNSEYSAGVENIAQDSQTGFLAPIFIRTVKLKDFPWNGWLGVGIRQKPAAAWNPIGGFADPAGRLIWFTVSDPALFPAPYDGSWIPNRVWFSFPPPGSTSGRVEVPEDALVPERGTGMLRKVGPGKTATTKILYKVLMSSFHDGTPMTVADLLYPFVFSYRWGARGQNRTEYDRVVDEGTALMRKRLAGVRVVRIEREIRDIGDVKLTWERPVIEVYLRSASSGPQDASVAPPWSTLPWHLIVLMEAAVKQGVAAFSLEEAERRGVGWLDLVRERNVRARLALLVQRFEREGYVPGALKEVVTVDEARQRWSALKQFDDTYGHFLVTNGPYRLEKWSVDSAVLEAFRDLSYPVGVGSFDQYVLPPRAYISKLERGRDGLQIAAEIEKAVRVQRSYTVVREPLTRKSSVGAYPVEPVCSYVVVGPDRAVLRAGAAQWADDGLFRVNLTGLAPGQYTVLTAIYLNGNRVNPDVRAVEYRVGP